MRDLSSWRSLLFVPAHVPAFVAKAHTRGADAIVLDLEDSVAPDRKVQARQSIAASAAMLAGQGQQVVVRINASHELAIADLDAAISADVGGIVLPKVESPEQVAAVAAHLGALERSRGLAEGRILFIAQIESARALSLVDDIARAPRVAGLNLGTEDFCASVGALPTAEALLYPSQKLLFAARSAGIVPLGFAGSIGEYTDLDAFRRTIRQARGLGFRGAFCIHPVQVPVLNEAFAPSAEEIEEAKALIEVYQASLAQGLGAASFRGRMIDPPVVARAEAVLRGHSSG